jgi:AraC-like DNA-binding protein
METVPSAEPSLRHEVRKAMYIVLPMGRARIEQVAGGLGLNVRTLQRQLDTAGESFSGLLNEVRRDLAMRYMAGKAHSLSQVGELLGYRTPSSFTRWFTAQFGTTPADWRRTRAVAADTGAAVTDC